jgi:hypothetical protein
VATNAGLQGQIDALLAPDTEAGDVSGTSVDAPFSPFIPAHARRGAQLAEELFQIADDQGLEQAVAAAQRMAETESSKGLVKRAVKTFVTHHPAAREALVLPTLTAVETAATLPPGEVDRSTLPSRTMPETEQALDWYREDPFANEHHAHWHDVWNTDGITQVAGKLVTQLRQGELFLYMHRQMLARYDTERLIAGFPAVIGFAAPYDAAIPEGYGAERYTTRPPDKKLRRVRLSATSPAVGPTDLAARYHRVDTAIGAEVLDVPALNLGTLDDNQLGAAIEPSDLALTPDQDVDLADFGYENIHGLGHVLTATVSDRGPDDTWFGVMLYTETAIRDPFFYRWHRHIDDQSTRLQDQLGAADLGEHAAAATFRGTDDIHLAFSSKVTDADFAAFARDGLGGDAFDDPDGLTTDTLTTRFELSRVSSPLPPDDNGNPQEESYWTTHLAHEPFGLFLRVEAAAAQHVTVRVFMAHEELVEDRRMWIELDKFDQQLAAGVNLIGRPDALSAVIKRKDVHAPGAVASGNGGDTWCDCGWPYGLLLPSGASTADGTAFKLAVILTDWESDHAGTPSSCGSMSYCGARQRYPDLREMGYPFHRPFPNGVLQTLSGLPNVALRDLTVRCETAERPA